MISRSRTGAVSMRAKTSRAVTPNESREVAIKMRKACFTLCSAGLIVLVALDAAGLVADATLANEPALSHGPLISDVTPDHVQIWGRTNVAASVAIEYARAGHPTFEATPTVVTAPGGDFTFTLTVSGLTADTAYDYRVLLNGLPSVARTFRTALPDGDPTELTVAFVSDAFHLAASTVWGALASKSPAGFFVIGDFDHSNPASNTTTATTYLEKVRLMHRRLRGPETPIGVDFAANVVAPGLPMLGRMLDDHDSGSDNVNSRFKWWGPNLQAFLEYHPVPADNGLSSGGMWQAIQRGRALFILIDVRSQRDPLGVKTILGGVQKQWLTEKLTQCKTDPTLTWCVLVTPVPFNPNQQKLDSWHGYLADSQWLLDQIAALQVENVLVVSGDCHWGSIVRKPLSPLDELNIPKVNEGFGNTCNNQPEQWTLNSAVGKPGFGLLTLRDNEAVMAIYNTDAARTLRMSSTVLAQGSEGGGDADGDGVPDSTDQCPDVPGVAPSGCPFEGGDVTETFTRTRDGEQFNVSVPPYVCRRSTGGSSLLRILKAVNGTEQILKSVSVSNPAKGVPFTLRCQVIPAAVNLYLDGTLRATATP